METGPSASGDLFPSLNCTVQVLSMCLSFPSSTDKEEVTPDTGVFFFLVTDRL